MKIEVGESLACSYLRHVKRCWIVQANWKAPAGLGQRQDAETLFLEMRQRFDVDGSVFKKTKDAGQFFKQGEIDVVGVDQQGGVHAMEVAFHEDGLNYKGSTEKRVLKKMLRTLFILRTYHLPETRIHIYFLSPKARPKVQKPLEITFDDLRREYADVEWHLLTNDDFDKSIVRPTLEKASAVADSSELFVRSVKLLETAGLRHTTPPVAVASALDAPRSEVPVQPLVPLVQALMRTLLVDHPSLLSDAEKSRLTDKACCKKMGLRIGFALIRKKECGKSRRYWMTYDCGDFYVCSQWSRSHRVNAESLLAFVEDVIDRKPAHKDTLHPHAQAFRDYLEKNSRRIGGHA